MTEETEEAEPETVGQEARTGSSSVPAAPLEDDWLPPRELILLLAGIAALACTAGVVCGVANKWTLPTIGVLFATGMVQALIAVGLAVRIAFAAHRRLGLYVPGLVVAVLATISLVGILLLSGII